MVIFQASYDHVYGNNFLLRQKREINLDIGLGIVIHLIEHTLTT